MSRPLKDSNHGNRDDPDLILLLLVVPGVIAWSLWLFLHVDDGSLRLTMRPFDALLAAGMLVVCEMVLHARAPWQLKTIVMVISLSLPTVVCISFMLS